MADTTLPRGFIPIDLDRRRVLIFDMAATWLLIERYGPQFLLQLYKVKDKTSFELVSMDALAYFLWAGLQRDANDHGEDLTLRQAEDFLRPWTYTGIFQCVLFAAVGATATPAMPGKAPADGAAAEPAVAPRKAAPKHPGPTKVSTSTRRSASRTPSSAGRRRSSGR